MINFLTGKIAGYKRFAVQLVRYAKGERLLLASSITVTVLAYLSDAIGFVLLIPIMESAQNLSGFDSVPLIGPVSQMFAGLTQHEKLMWAATALLLITLVRGALLYLAEIASYSLTPRVESRIRMLVFDNLYRMPISHVEGISAGDLSNLTSANPARVAVTVRFVQILVANLIIVAINTLMMAVVSPNITFTMIGLLIMLTILYKRMTSADLTKAGQDQTQASSDFGQLFYNMLNGMRLVRLSGATEQTKAKLSSSVADMRAANLRRLTIEATVYPFFSTTIGVLFCSVLIVTGAFQLGESAKLIATMIATIYLMTRMLGPMTYINVARINIAANLDAFDSLEEFFRTAHLYQEQDGTHELKRFGTDLRFTSVSFRYPNQEVDALRSFNLVLKKGERVGLVGVSGSGKSTVISLLARITRPYAGQILIDGHDLNQIQIESWWERIAVVLQDMVLVRDSIRANLTQGVRIAPTDDEIWVALEVADIAEVVRALPNGIDTILADRGIGLSGGERQRLSLARALLRKPELLILDEASSNLDVQTEARIVKRLSEWFPELTTLVIAHRLGAVQSCDRILVMTSGEIVREIHRDDSIPDAFPPMREILPNDVR